MNLFFDTKLGKQQNKATHKIRVMSEAWLEKNGYCPCCGSKPMQRFTNNKPVADLFCPNCHEQYELKSKNQKTIGNSVPDGAYHTMLERIQSDTNPNFFFLAYKKADYSIQQLVLVPKHFITPDMIIPRNKGIKNRPHHIMCSINLVPLPESGKIFLIDNSRIIEPEIVLKKWQSNLFLRNQNAERKGWLLAIMKCIDQLPKEFTLSQIYEFENKLSIQFPQNNHIKDKIRQQLQILRDQNMIKFIGRDLCKKALPSTAETQTQVFGCFLPKSLLILPKYPLNPPRIPDNQASGPPFRRQQTHLAC